MADISLDEFIRQKNVKVEFRNNQSSGQTQKSNPHANFQSKNVQRTFDARSKLGPKKAIADARDKIIINKKSGKGDARNKIVQKQVQKGTFDARSKLKRQSNKTNGAMNNPQMGNTFAGIQPITRTGNTFAGIQPITRTLSNIVNSGQFSQPLIMQVPNTGVSISRNPTQNTKRGMSGPPPVSSIGEAVPIIQIRNDKYKQWQGAPPSQPNWSNQSSQNLPQPAHQEMHHSHPSSLYHPNKLPYPSHSHYRDLDNPDLYSRPSLRVQEIPKMHISNIKAVESAGMRPVSARPGPSQARVPPGAATLSAKQSITISQPPSLKRRQPMQEVTGPLRLGKGGGPGLQVGIGESSPPKKTKIGATPSEAIEIIEEDNSKFVSPLQGYRVIVTNLFSRVTQDDIIELFGVVGPLKKAKLLKAGSAEVVYCTREDAVKAVQKYHGRELDGQPMYVKMTTPSTAVVKKPLGGDPDITGEALRLYKKPSSLGALPVAPIETPTIHRALFKVGPPAPNKSVKFTVKI